MTTKTRSKYHAALKWAAVGIILIAGGFAVDGSTEVGHHLFLIFGGGVIGFGMKGVK